MILEGGPSSSWGGVFISCDCHNEQPQTKWLKTTEINAHSSGSWKPKIQVSAGTCFLRNLEGQIRPTSHSFRWVLICLGVPWL